jgi:Fe-S oxidoreductase
MGFGEGVKLFEEWWVEAWDRKQIQFTPISQPAPVALHGHCHQKAAGAVPAITRALESVGYVVTPITSSCCGMAGAFGLRPENQDISKAMAELSLAPAIRALPPDTLVVADGLSCQHQISDLTPREALHAVEALALALGESLDNA